MRSDFTSRFLPIPAFKLTTLALVVLGICSGCGAKGSGTMPTLIPVKGKVTFKGQPLSKGTVHFEPDDYGRPATGELQSDGTFVLTTLTEGDGVVAGHHRVCITDTDAKSKSGALPKKYAILGASKLEADVSEQNKEFTFEIP